MKKIKLAIIALFTVVLVYNVNAQDSNNPWAVSFGVNMVDLTQKDGIFKDYLGTKDWNTLPSVSRITGEKYITNGLSAQLAMSLNQIEDVTYYAFDANAKYDLDNLMEMSVGKTQWFNPYAVLGLGYASIDGNGGATLNVGGGFNTWFNESFGLNFQTGLKHGFEIGRATCRERA